MIDWEFFAAESFGYTYFERQVEVYNPMGMINPPLLARTGQRPACQWSLFQ